MTLVLLRELVTGGRVKLGVGMGLLLEWQPNDSTAKPAVDDIRVRALARGGCASFTARERERGERASTACSDPTKCCGVGVRDGRRAGARGICLSRCCSLRVVGRLFRRATQYGPVLRAVSAGLLLCAPYPTSFRPGWWCSDRLSALRCSRCRFPDGDGPYCIGDAAGGVWDGAEIAK
jgi:hypothetical protein